MAFHTSVYGGHVYVKTCSKLVIINECSKTIGYFAHNKFVPFLANFEYAFVWWVPVLNKPKYGIIVNPGIIKSPHLPLIKNHYAILTVPGHGRITSQNTK